MGDGEGDSERNPMQERLVQRFLKKWEGYPAAHIERQVEGITDKDVHRYRKDTWKWLTGAKIDALAAEVGEAPTDEMTPDEAPDGD